MKKKLILSLVCMLVGSQLFGQTPKKQLPKFLFVGKQLDAKVVEHFNSMAGNLKKSYTAEFFAIKNFLTDYYQKRAAGTDSNQLVNKLKEEYNCLVYIQPNNESAIKHPELFLEEVRILKKRADAVEAKLLVTTVCFKDDADKQKKADQLAHRISKALDVEFIPVGQAWHKLTSTVKKNADTLSYLQAAGVNAYLYKRSMNFNSKKMTVSTSIKTAISKAVMKYCTKPESTPYTGKYSGYCTALEIPFSDKEKDRFISWGTSTERGIGAGLKILTKDGYKADQNHHINAYKYERKYYPDTLQANEVLTFLKDNHISVFLARFNGPQSLDAVTKASKNKDIRYIGFLRHHSDGSLQTLGMINAACGMNMRWHEKDPRIMCLPLHIAYGRMLEEKPEYDCRQGQHQSAIYLRAMSGMVYTMLTGKNAAELPVDCGDTAFAYNMGYEVITQLGSLEKPPELSVAAKANIAKSSKLKGKKH